MRVCQFRHFGTMRSRTDSLSSVVGIFDSCRPARRLSNSTHFPTSASWLYTKTPPVASCDESQMETPPKIPADVSTKLRSLAHDLSNAIETLMQAGYLLGQAKLDGDPKKWVGLIDTASRDAARINREIRDILRTNSE
jgi:hypothetical protein